MNPHERDTKVSFKLFSCQITKSHSHTHEESEIPPGQFYLNHLGARGLHPTGVLMRTLWRIEKYPLGDSIRITRGLRGYTRRVCSRAPSGESKTPWAILSESPGGSGATPVGCAHAHPLASQITPRAIRSESPGGSGATIEDLVKALV